jgi:hypothetical protein
MARNHFGPITMYRVLWGKIFSTGGSEELSECPRGGFRDIQYLIMENAITHEIQDDITTMTFSPYVSNQSGLLSHSALIASQKPLQPCVLKVPCLSKELSKNSNQPSSRALPSEPVCCFTFLAFG